MALEDIFRALEEQADSDIGAMLADAQEGAEAIVERARSEADAARDTRVADAERDAVARNSQSLNSARLDARKRVANVKECVVSEVFAEAASALAEMRKRPDYDKMFRGLADEALSGVDGAFEVLVDPADVDLAKKVLAEKGLIAEVKPGLSTVGGLIVATNNGSVLRRNTFEERLKKLRGLAQADVAEIVFA
ncbi:MAG: V-type ATP synthase subunit E [Coriobacteriia bacterium]|nr:V-type ATP synthase subunit E [Coriobacteriia bacterium]